MIVTKVIFVPFTSKIASRKGDIKAVQSFGNIAYILGAFVSFTAALQAAAFGNLVTVLGAIAAAATVAIGFGMRDQVASVVAGIFIHTDNPFLKGDYIKVKEFEGVVVDINLRTTVLNGKNNEKQLVPNNLLTTDVVKNYSKGKKTKAVIDLTTNSKMLEKDEEQVLEILESLENVLSRPTPDFRIKDVEKEEVKCEVRFWLRNSEDVKEVKSNFLREFAVYRSQNPLEVEKED